jgi:hypothetical protein
LWVWGEEEADGAVDEGEEEEAKGLRRAERKAGAAEEGAEEVDLVGGVGSVDVGAILAPNSTSLVENEPACRRDLLLAAWLGGPGVGVDAGIGVEAEPSSFPFFFEPLPPPPPPTPAIAAWAIPLSEPLLAELMRDENGWLAERDRLKTGELAIELEGDCDSARSGMGEMGVRMAAPFREVEAFERMWCGREGPGVNGPEGEADEEEGWCGWEKERDVGVLAEEEALRRGAISLRRGCMAFQAMETSDIAPYNISRSVLVNRSSSDTPSFSLPPVELELPDTLSWIDSTATTFPKTPTASLEASTTPLTTPPSTPPVLRLLTLSNLSSASTRRST